MSLPIPRIALLLVIALVALAPSLVAAASPAVRCSHRPAAGEARCYAQVLASPKDVPLVSSSPSGYGPSQFHVAYGVPAKASQPPTVAVVAAYHDPNITRDLHSYDAAFGLSDPPKFSQVSQRGGSDFPTVDAGWALEISMDVETIHGMCQNCPILLVEADSPSQPNLMAAIDLAVARGAKVVSNSYGGPESATEVRYDSHLQRPGVTVVASSGDSGYGVEYPAASSAVVAVGGTTLRLASSGSRLAETAWAKGGSGCSRFEPKPAWQHDVSCGTRAVADVAADADPATGAAIYDSLPYASKQGWFVLGGTSLAAPLVAGMYGLAGGGGPQGLYQHPAGLRDIASGRNGSCRTYLCLSGLGYDGPTGLGSPFGLSAFR